MDDLSNKTIEQLKAIVSADITDFCSFGGGTLRVKPFKDIDSLKLPALR